MRKTITYTWSKGDGSKRLDDLNGMQLSMKRQLVIISLAIKAFENNEKIKVGIYENSKILYRVVIEPNKYGVEMFFYNSTNELTVVRTVTKKELYN